jgi:hypothetical protein
LNVTADVFPYLQAWLMGKELYLELLKTGGVNHGAVSWIYVQANTSYKISISNVNPLLCRSTGNLIPTWYWLNGVWYGSSVKGGGATTPKLNPTTMTLEQLASTFGDTGAATKPEGDFVLSNEFDNIDSQNNHWPFVMDRVTKKVGAGDLLVAPTSKTGEKYKEALYSLGLGLYVGIEDNATEGGNSFSDGKNNQDDVYVAKGGGPIITISAYLPTR